MIRQMLTMGLLLWAGSAAAQVVTWTDGSAGTASTEVKVTSEDGVLTIKQLPGMSTLSLVETIKAMTSPWFCVQARHVYPDGKVSGWFLSESEGICKLRSQFPSAPVVEPPPIVVMPPPIVPPPPPPSAFSAVTAQGNTLAFSYQTTACPKGIQMTSGKIINGSRTVTMTCRK